MQTRLKREDPLPVQCRLVEHPSDDRRKDSVSRACASFGEVCLVADATDRLEVKAEMQGLVYLSQRCERNISDMLEGTETQNAPKQLMQI